MLGNQSVVNDTTSDWQTPPPAGFAPGGGQLGALKTLATTTLPGYLASLDAVAKTLHDDVNAAYGSSFFTGATAATLGTGIAAASTITAGSGTGAASNDLAAAVAALRDRRRDHASTAGSCARSAPTPRRGERPVDRPGRRRRRPGPPPDVSGVSLDEEMANMLRFQRGYQASARAMSTIDDMLDTLINRAGRVGL